MKKMTTSKVVFFLIAGLTLLSASVFSQSPNQNSAMIRNDRVIILNGHPFFPIGTCFEREDHFAELVDNGFNFINLFSDNHFVYSDSCGFHSKNIISGDVTTSEQYNELLGLYARDLRWESNASRIFEYMRNNQFYIFADDFSFYPDDLANYIINSGSCGDSIVLNPKFNQTVRNGSVDRLISISNWPDNRLIGVYAKDDANMFNVGNPDPLYYYNTYFNSRLNNYRETYSQLKSGFPNSLVLMSLPNTYFPRAFDYSHWTDANAAREAWIRDAAQFFQYADVLFCPDYLTYEWYGNNFMIYDNKLPSVYPYDLEQTVFGRLVPGNKAVFGGLLFDPYESLPDSTDPTGLTKVKWHIYVGLEKGCTGLIFFGWHKYARPDGGKSIVVWNYIKTIINEMVLKLHLNEDVFVKTNSGEIGHSISGSNSNNVSYAVYKINDWNDYYLLVTNNPNESLFAHESDNIVTISANINNIDWGQSLITEIFSGQNIQVQSNLSIRFNMPAYGTALFHVQEFPKDFRLYQNYPNPFNPNSRIKYQIAKLSDVKLTVYNAIGQKISELVNQKQNQGIYEVEWNASNFPSGVYFCKLTAGNFVATRKMVLIK